MFPSRRRPGGTACKTGGPRWCPPTPSNSTTKVSIAGHPRGAGTAHPVYGGMKRKHGSRGLTLTTPVSVSWDGPDNVSPSGRLRQQAFIVAQCRRPEVRDQGAAGLVASQDDGGVGAESVPRLCSSFRWPRHPAASRGSSAPPASPVPPFYASVSEPTWPL